MMSKLLAQNIRRPTGWFGRLLVWAMNIEHSSLTDWGLQHISLEEHYTVLDVGCGGGRTIHKLAGIAARGKVYGIDLSEESVMVSSRTNQQLIRMGRAEIRRGSVSSLPFSDSTFDLVTAVETHYFWPDLVAGMQEILRVLKPGGNLMIIGEIYKGGKYDHRNQKFGERMNLAYQSVDELSELFSRAGYTYVHMFEEYDKGWICGIGRRPERPSGEQEPVR